MTEQKKDMKDLERTNDRVFFFGMRHYYYMCAIWPVDRQLFDFSFGELALYSNNAIPSTQEKEKEKGTTYRHPT